MGALLSSEKHFSGQRELREDLPVQAERFRSLEAKKAISFPIQTESFIPTFSMNQRAQGEQPGIQQPSPGSPGQRGAGWGTTLPGF